MMRLSSSSYRTAAGAVRQFSLRASVPILKPSAAFESASNAVQLLPVQPSNEDKLALYALFKQATSGKNSAPRPGLFDIVGKYKWEAHSKLGDMSKEEAERQYVALCRRLGALGEGSSSSVPLTTSPGAITVTDAGHVRTIAVGGGETKGRWNADARAELAKALNDALALSSSIRALVLTGTGDTFGVSVDGDELTTTALSSALAAVAAGPQLFIAAVNGPAVGGAVVTAVAFADVVYASHKATFHCPIGTEGPGAASVDLPVEAIQALAGRVGRPRALELLALGKKWTAGKATLHCLVDDVFEDSELRAQVASTAAAGVSTGSRVSVASVKKAI